MLRSYSVIVPVFNGEQDVVRTLQSIRDSIGFFDANHSEADKIVGEVIVVDDGSTDATAERVRDFGRTNSWLRLIQHSRNFGAGAARNTGVRTSRGEVLFFCDADDLYFPEHLFVGFSLLDHSARFAGSTSGRMHLRVGERGHVVLGANDAFAAVRTGVHIKDEIHPYWMPVIQNTLTQNLCLRRECHDWGEGYPEELVYKRIGGCEDGAYSLWLETFFRVGRVDLQTVEHVRRPGNSFDRQVNRFRHAPGSEFDIARPDPLHEIRLRREQEKVGYLLDKWHVVGPPSLSPVLLNWEGVLRELLRRRRITDAIRIAEKANQQGVVLPVDVADEVRGVQERLSTSP